ncbi:hypothetical protein N9R79_01065 [Vibrio sp.]|nr:hypothetical protein [Vibrio sp.]
MEYYSKVNENDVAERKRLFGIKPGVYILRSGEVGNPKPIPRMCSVDNDGILYIGMSKKLSGGRVSDLKKSLSLDSPSDSHNVGKHYRSNKLLQENYPYDDFYLELISAETRSEAGCIEGTKLQEYLDNFGELPPFNRTA